MNKLIFPRLGETCYETVLDNGLTVCVVPRPGFQKSYAFFAAGYGGMNLRCREHGTLRETPAGVAHFLEHKMFDMKEGNALQMLTANGASPNAFTSTDITAYYFDCTEQFDENLRILLTFVSQPWFTQESVEKEQGIIGQEIRMIEDNPDWRLYQNLLRAMYQHNPLRIPIAGSVESIAEITADTLYQCHEAFYCPGNMVLCVVGDVDRERVIAMARAILPAEGRERAQKELGDPEPDTPVQARISETMEVAAPNFMLGFKAHPHPEGEEHLRLQLIGDLAGDLLAGESSPMYARLYARGLIDKTFFASYENNPGAAYLLMGGESREPDKVAEAVLAEGERLRREGIDSALFQRCKKAAYGSRVRALNAMEHVSVQLVRGKLNGYHYYRFPELYDSITQGDVERFLDELITERYAALSVITPKEPGQIERK